MSSHDEILKEDKKWYQAFKESPVVGNCDSGCGNPAQHWFGNTAIATCGKSDCIDIQNDLYAEL